MENSYRKSMTWLHTYSGLILGWLLFAIFVTGTSSYYQKEITLWMQPELHKSKENEKTLDIAIDKALDTLEISNNVSVELPNSRGNTIKISKNSGGHHHHGPNGEHIHGPNGEHIHGPNGEHIHGPNGEHIHGPNGEHISVPRKGDKLGIEDSSKGEKKDMKRGPKPKPDYYDASTGEKLEPRDTQGGEFLYRFHFELYSLPRDIATWIVGIATMSMFIAIITGVIMHKRIFKDIFTFRPKNSPRGWMDAHILPAVATLPFLIMITYSGLILFTETMMPWAMNTHYKGNFGKYMQDMDKILFSKKENENDILLEKKIIEINNEKNVAKIVKTEEVKIDNPKNRDMIRHLNKNLQKNIHQKSLVNTKAQRLISSNNQKYKTQHISRKSLKENAFSKEKLKAILLKGSSFYENGISSFTLKKEPVSNNVKVELKPNENSSIFSYKRDKDSITFDGNSGKLLKISEASVTPSTTFNIENSFRSLHMALFAEPTLRFIFFLFGMSGIVIVGTGLIIWTEKRKHKNEKKKSFGFWLVEKLNIGTVVGLFIAIGIYFIANRFISADEIMRSSFEINAFFIAWTVSYIHAFIRDTKKAWIEQLTFASLLFISIPILNAVLIFENISWIYQRDSILLSFDIFFVFLFLVFSLITFIARKKFKKGEV